MSDSELLAELGELSGDSAEAEDHFYRELEFGTGGLRGILGVGTNRMNRYTVSKATQGYSNYLNKNFSAPSVAIAYDSRLYSDLFARYAAEVFAGNRITVHLYDHLMPTPSLSFAVRDLHCSGGIVITASHNSAKYNGYKVYGPDGCQITTEAAKQIQKEIDKIDPFTDIRSLAYDRGVSENCIQIIVSDTIRRYLDAVRTSSVLPEGISKDVSIVYTPLNGTGISCVPQCLQEHGFTRILLPEEQRTPDGHFLTCPFPNPEVRGALEVGLRLAERTGSELLLATDPDCDRVGAAVRDGDDYTLINGNEMGVLLFDFLCRLRTETGTMPTHPVAIKTIVTTPMAEKIAVHYGVELINVLTGFKFIGEQISQLERRGEEARYIFGFEESYGYLSGSFVRDKDAVNASLLICEMFAYYKTHQKTLVDVLNGLYETYGFYRTRLLSFQFDGLQGLSRMQTLMQEARVTPPAQIAGQPVVHNLDYQQEGTGLPMSNVLSFDMAQASAVIRPSGTEPKLKVYLTAWAASRQGSDDTLDRMEQWFQTRYGK